MDWLCAYVTPVWALRYTADRGPKFWFVPQNGAREGPMDTAYQRLESNSNISLDNLLNLKFNK
jgi:hypothetical protein